MWNWLKKSKTQPTQIAVAVEPSGLAQQLPDLLEPTSLKKTRAEIIRPAKRRKTRRPTLSRPARPRCRRIDGEALQSWQTMLGRETCKRLEQSGVRTVGDLMVVSVNDLCTRFDQPAEKVRRRVRRWQATLDLAAEITGLRPADACLLVAIHRHSSLHLAKESPTRLLADLRRFLRSTPGRRRFPRYDLPPITVVSKWVAEARQRHGMA